MLQEDALVIAEKLHVDGFVASNEWLERFKNAHNISTMAVAGEEADFSPRTLESWKERSKELIKGWQPENFWNMDETGCLTENGKRCSGGKQSKQRNIWAYFVNDAGGKEDPVIISHAVQHRCFKHLKDRKRSYFSNKKAWMTNNIMDDILRSLNQR